MLASFCPWFPPEHLCVPAPLLKKNPPNGRSTFSPWRYGYRCTSLINPVAVQRSLTAGLTKPFSLPTLYCHSSNERWRFTTHHFGSTFFFFFQSRKMQTFLLHILYPFQPAFLFISTRYVCWFSSFPSWKPIKDRIRHGVVPFFLF